MKKLVNFFIVAILSTFSVNAEHITGGEMYYTYVSASGNSYTYSFTMKLYMRCNSGRMFNDPSIISVFEKGTGDRMEDIQVPLSSRETLQLTNPDPCISNPPDVCYEVGYYYFTVTVPASSNGYVVTGQVNFRINGIANLSQGYNQIGASYTAEIPGTQEAEKNMLNKSARFTGNDLVIVCAASPFKYSFAASDGDNDELQYTFCSAFKSSVGPVFGGGGGGGGGGNSASPSLPPPYESVPYGDNFSGSAPLGNKVSIDSKTGLISGIAPAAGLYVVTVCVSEIRNGKVIATQRKDLQIAITSCALTAAILDPEYLLCRDTKTINLSNQSQSSLIRSYFWQLNDATGKKILESTTPVVNYNFPDTGVYSIKLVINKDKQCSDSTTSVAKVFPGLKADFSFRGICFTKNTFFTDNSSSAYGTVDSWRWDFGEVSDFTDMAITRNARYIYPTLGPHYAKLAITDSKGCKDSVTNVVNVYEKPPVNLAFRDTLICPPDALQLSVKGNGIFTWTPNNQLTNPNSATPTVSPLVTTKYYVELDDDGCINHDSVLVRVTNTVSVKARNDTIICAGDDIVLFAQTNGLSVKWSPASQLNNAALIAPVATTPTTTTYQVTAFISQCEAKDEVVVTTIPYPVVDAGNDTLICFNTSAKLNGNTPAKNYSWIASNSMSDPNILNPVVTPELPTYYYLTVTDNKGCPKPVTDSVLVTVLPDINPEATNDTSAVLGQALQLRAKGGTSYFWYPSIALSNTEIADPVALYSTPFESIRYTVRIFNEAGCVDSASLTVKIFSTPPTVFVPTAFTPNGDGKNDVLKPIAVGMKKIERFTIYNRFGQRVFGTSAEGMGWDGKINGVIQQTNAYVWLVEAIDHTGKKYVEKGTTTLIR